MSNTHTRSDSTTPPTKIAYWGCLAIAVNNLTGPGMLDLPATFQESGVIPTVVVIVFVSILSSLTSLSLANLIAKKPNNSNFQHEIEYSDLFGYEKLTHILFFCTIMSQCVASVVNVAQVIDAFIATLGPQTYAVQFTPEPEIVAWVEGECDHHKGYHHKCLPFQKDLYNQGFILTTGYAIAAVLLFPLGLMNLTENVSSQLLSFVLLLVFLAEFIFAFIIQGDDVSRVPLFGNTSSYFSLFGVVFFNFALTPTIPSLLHSKSSDTSITKVIFHSNILVVGLYVILGYFGADSIPKVPSNFLAYLSQGRLGFETGIVSDLFSFFIIGLGIPLFQVVMRNNLVNTQMATERTGKFVCVILPWALSWFLYQGDAVLNVLSWSGLILNGLVGYIMPLYAAYSYYNTHKSAISERSQLLPDDAPLGYAYGVGATPPVSILPKTIKPKIASFNRVSIFPKFLVKSQEQEKTATAILGLMTLVIVVMAIIGKIITGGP
ncbi:hypothetical protein TL16_g09765 [Triparma laevis f. inornata]|uniref:Amino acid transporter transmembrane domain-containing protein n=2 Tax=Triparma laevis TaxID=1534972 RepID=A0A9W7AFA1_9STRA|nr:hypothetical protein TrLO_g15079 [Triparma laevis f. longispina]GMH83946.1 hypothetical protein TL16_g09765 [Triparma laevis f. inornata]